MASGNRSPPILACSGHRARPGSRRETKSAIAPAALLVSCACPISLLACNLVRAPSVAPSRDTCGPI